MKLLGKLTATLLGAAASSFGQWDVNNVSANTVKAGTGWGSVRMRLDTLDLDVSVSGGLLRTRATMTWTPDSLTTEIYTVAPNDCQADTLGEICPAPLVKKTAWLMADSLEMRQSFQLPLDAAATGMWLWVGENKEAAYVMDRWKATQQYTQIVGARRDPALLETWGNGSYNLSLFPLKSGETRKLQIEIVQALKDGFKLPFAARSAYRRWNSAVAGYVDDTIRAGVVRLSVKSDVATGNSLDLGSLGVVPMGTESSIHTWTRPDSFVAIAKGRQPDVWTAMRDGKGAFGSSITFKGMDLAFEPEPTNRLVVLDADDSLERCKKLALLALLKYGQAPNKVNLAWRDESGLRHLWPEPASLSDRTGLEALAFLKAWKPSVKSDAQATLHEVAKSDTGSVVVLVSTSPYETFGLNYPGYSSDTTSSTYRAYRSYLDSSNRFNQRVTDIWAAIAQELAGADQTLFGWWNNGYVGNAASSTGGFSFGSVDYPWYRWWIVSDSISAPALFGPMRYGYRENPENLKVELEGIQIDSLAYMFKQGNGGWWWGGPIWSDGVVMTVDKISIVLARSAAQPSGSYDDSLPVVFAARYAHGGPAKLKLSGTWGGLTFSGSRSFQVPNPSGTEWGTRVWAGEYANMAQPNIWSDTGTQGAVRRLGKDYQIVTPATSFLALEPGVHPLDSLAGQTEGTSDAAVGVLSVKSAQYVAEDSRSGTSLDNTSLDDLLLGRITSIKKLAVPAVVGLRIHSGSMVDFEVLGHDASVASVRILDIHGREVARVAMTRLGERLVASWTPSGRGVFFAVAQGALWKHTSTFTVGR